MQDPSGEAKNFIFNKIRQKDLKYPNIAIPMGVRWLFRNREIAMSKLKRVPNNEEVILEFKGLLKSKTNYKNAAFEKYKGEYARFRRRKYCLNISSRQYSREKSLRKKNYKNE